MQKQTFVFKKNPKKPKNINKILSKFVQNVPLVGAVQQKITSGIVSLEVLKASFLTHTCLTFRPSLTLKTMILIADSDQIFVYKWGPWSNLTLYSHQGLITRSGLPWVDFDRPWIKANQRFLSVCRWILVRGCSTEMLGPLVDSVPLEFSRLPAMLSPLKTTLFPVSALASWRQLGECITLLNSGCL